MCGFSAIPTYAGMCGLFHRTHLRGYAWIVPPYPLTRVWWNGRHAGLRNRFARVWVQIPLPAPATSCRPQLSGGNSKNPNPITRRRGLDLSLFTAPKIQYCGVKLQCYALNFVWSIQVNTQAELINPLQLLHKNSPKKFVISFRTLKTANLFGNIIVNPKNGYR